MIQINKIISDLRINDFESLLKYFCLYDKETNVCIDGGAGLGETADKILKSTMLTNSVVVAFEPNKENCTNFVISDDRLFLIESAMGKTDGVGNFSITSNTKLKEKDSNKFLKTGTSFVGKLDSYGVSTENTENYSVKIEKLSSSLGKLNIDKVDFVKLDLQGGELDALYGFDSYLSTTKWMWIEYGGQAGLLEYLLDNNFVVFDTEYLFVGTPNNLIEDLFYISRIGNNSIGRSIFFGFRKHEWSNFAVYFDFMQRHRRLIQTDLLVINKNYMTTFFNVLNHIINPVAEPLPEIFKTLK